MTPPGQTAGNTPVSTRPSSQHNPQAQGRPSADETERTAELLRMALPMMSRHGRGFAPISYAVWYEYVRGENEDLRAELDKAIGGDGDDARISDNLTSEMYNRHIQGKIEAAINRGRAGLLDLLQQVDESVDATTDSASQFDSKLEEFSQGIDGDMPAEQIRERVESLRKDVAGVNSSMQGLHDQLASSRSEVQKMANELARAKEQAQLDPLTGILNRRGYDEALAAVMKTAEEQGKPLSLVVVDIDKFKLVNDTYGHLFGDKVIQGIAKILDGGVMRKDFVARFGGEEFVVILPETDLPGGVAVAERIREAVAKSRIRRAKSTEVVSNITISAGVTSWVPGEEGSDFLERADKALYRAKDTGRNKVCQE